VIVAVASSGDNPGRSLGLVARAQRGPLPVTVTETGEVEAERRKVIANELRWPVIILEVVEEGTVVKEGQTIVKFECKELADEIERQELEVTAAENSYIQAKQNLELQQQEMDNRVLKATRALDDAKRDRDQYVKHDYPIEFASKDNAVKIAEQRLVLAEDRLAFKKRVNQMPELESPFSENDIKADELEVQQLRNSLKTARLELEKLQRYEHKRRLGDLDEAIADAELALRRAKLEREREMLMARSNERAKKRTYEMRKERLEERLEDQKKLTVKAEKAGLVVYDTGRGRWQPSDVRVAKGEKIQPRQQIMVIPDMSSLQIKTKVYEAIIDQVREGIPARIRLDSRPDVTLPGKVTRVAPLPDSQNRWLNPGVKVFSVTVGFDEAVEGLKPGMTAEVEMELARLEDVLTVPIAAVFTERGKTVCYRRNGGKCERVTVKIGRMNDRRVQIVSGLAQGDEVFLAEPPEAREAAEAEGAKVAAPGARRSGGGSAGSAGGRPRRGGGRRKGGRR